MEFDKDELKIDFNNRQFLEIWGKIDTSATATAATSVTKFNQF